MCQVSDNADVASKITQIDNSDPYLYNFNTEVRLLLEAMVARTVEESLRESIAEEEDKMTRSESDKLVRKLNIQFAPDRRIFKNHEDEILALKIHEN